MNLGQVSNQQIFHVPVSDSAIDRGSFSECRDKVKKS